jgi:hypothetical protein
VQRRGRDVLLSPMTRLHEYRVGASGGLWLASRLWAGTATFGTHSCKIYRVPFIFFGWSPWPVGSRGQCCSDPFCGINTKSHRTRQLAAQKPRTLPVRCHQSSVKGDIVVRSGSVRLGLPAAESPRPRLFTGAQALDICDRGRCDRRCRFHL